MVALSSMRVLVVHNRYLHRGGEDTVVDTEVDLLRARGHEVATYIRSNEDIHAMSRLRVAKETLWSARTVGDISGLIDTFKPDIIHAHNTFPLVSPALYWAASRREIPVVQTLHNFRLLCPQAMFLRDGKICESCLGKGPWPGVLNRCYRDSVAQSGVLAAMLGMHRLLGTYRNHVARYIALNEFCRAKFVQGGIPQDKISIKPNFVEDPGAPADDLRSGALFVGRLSPEKGIGVLVEAACRAGGIAVDVIGTGPVEQALRSQSNIRLWGWQEPSFIQQKLRSSAYLVMPSIWYETFGMVAVEAFAAGLPVIASRLGAMAELVADGETGLLFEPGDARDLAEKMRWANENPQVMRKMGEAARRVYEERYTPHKNYARLISIYEAARD